MKVLVVGGGGREHALAWKLKQSSKLQCVYVAPGNAGTARDKDLVNVPFESIEALGQWAVEEKIALTVVGPEAPLSQGIVDHFRALGLRIFGPTQAAAQLESSKAFAKAFMVRHGIPTAHHATFTDLSAAQAHVLEKGAPIVIKADGLAAGKGVVVAMTLPEALQALQDMLGDNQNGQSRVVVEEYLQGEEASFIVVCDGREVVPLATSQDHKRLLDGDQGPNTGGMGAYSPAPVVTAQVHARAMREVILPAIRGLHSEGIDYTGFLYAGLMIDAAGHIKTLEFNCRMGDPETQPIVMRLKSDLFDLLMAATTPGGLAEVQLDWDRRAAVGVVMAAAHYPGQPRSGDVIEGLPPDDPDCVVFHAGTRLHQGQVLTAGGRVLCATALGGTLHMAQQRAYSAVKQIQFAGQQHRQDIGHRALAKRSSAT